ncbi:protein prenylyltransferase [Fistulina hepatica ATCC 64428]|uniref:Protein farnesyltransferase/geranylgeranyltransferase type-1 subunit alpha n=1 Tax=Fistulina hepatica ATCC 64428 TaxID=1128425 RepID=A0A0D7AE06_9AGAR|nr:protein prenylyltransferase [Fistulina hepatica ATCC 64428]
MASSKPTPILYSERPEWQDVKPLPQYENVNPLAPIFYTDEYRDATDYFRGIVKVGEKSERVLTLTEHIIRLNPAHYSAWQYRYQTLMALKAPLDEELRLMDELAVKFLKTYQVWHHRRLLVMVTGKPAPELRLTEMCLRTDAKNYHTWSHRQWLLAQFNDNDLWAGELDFVEQLLGEDIRNNSAWHHRFFVVYQSGTRAGEQDRERVNRRELIFVKHSISIAPNNASAWNYLRGVLDHNKIPYSSLQSFVEMYTRSAPPADRAGIVDLENPGPDENAQLPCVAAIEFLADIYESEGEEGIPKAKELWASLAHQYDTVRKRYWDYRARCYH